jgi:hypothetical protein
MPLAAKPWTSAPMPAESTAPLRRIAELFQRHGVEYLIIGGQAAQFMGCPRITYDTDVCYRRTPKNLRRLAAALKELDVSLRGAPKGLPFKPDEKALHNGLNFTLDSAAGPLDLIGEVEPIGDYDALARHAETYELWGMRFRTLSLEDLMRVKKHLGRPKDLELLQMLMAIKRMREEQKNQPPPAS